MAINKVIFGNDVKMDITDTTAEPSDVAAGEVFYGRDGVRKVGTGNYMDKVPGATQYNVAYFDDNGQVQDSGLSMADRATMRAWYSGANDFGSFVEQAQGTSDMKSFGFMNTTDTDILYWSMANGSDNVGKHIPTKNYVDTAIPTEATETVAGIVKLNPNQNITLNANGQLEVGGRIGQFSGTTGLYAPNDRDPRNVGNYSFLITDAMGMDLNTSRAFALVSGLGVTCKSAAAGSTEYRVTNNYNNRITCKAAEGGYISLSEAKSNVERIVPVVSVTINGAAFTPDSSANSSNDIIIKTAETINPDAATTSIRIFPVMKAYSTAHIGNGIASWGGGRNFLLGGGVTKDGNGNDNCVVSNGAYVNGNGNAVFGRSHIIRKNRGFFAGQGHDSTNATGEGVSAIGNYSYIDGNTMFAVGNGTDQVKRLNLFEVLKDGSIVLRSPNGTRYKIAVSNAGAITATTI